MSKKVVLELKDDEWLYDANGKAIIFTQSLNYKYFEKAESTENTKSTIELVKLGVSVDEIIKLKNMDLI